MNVDTIIVGQGIAGMAMAYRLVQNNISFVVIDSNDPSAASKVSSALINPITGRNFVKSWMIDDLLPEALRFYKGISTTIGQDIIGKRLIIRSLDGAKQENQWYSRLSQPEYQKYIPNEYKGPDLGKYFNESFSFGQVSQSFHIKCHEMIAGFKKYLKESDRLYETTFDYSRLETGQEIIYEHIKSKRIIFAEGWRGELNPYFSDLPWRPAKGEILICRIPDFPRTHNVKYHKFLVPIKDDLFWVGSTYEWDKIDNKPTPEKRNEIIAYLNRYLKLDYEIVDHKIGIRPATKYRKPFIGAHHEIPNVHIFNGLGTKGFSLAPYWSKYLTETIFENRTKPHSELPVLYK